MPNVTPQATQKVARQLAIANAPDETPQPPGPSTSIPLRDSAELPGPSIPLPDEPDTPMITPVVQLPGEPETPQLQPPPVGEPETPYPQRSTLKNKRSSILDYVRNSVTATSVADAANRLAAARQAPPTRILQDTQLIGTGASSSSSSSTPAIAQTPANTGRKAKSKCCTNVWKRGVDRGTQS